jgi:hypothetical protein
MREFCHAILDGGRHVCRFPKGHEGDHHPHMNAESLPRPCEEWGSDAIASLLFGFADDHPVARVREAMAEAAVRLRALRVIADTRATNTFLADVEALLGRLRLGTHARPVSAHVVVHWEILPAIARLQAFLDYVMQQRVTKPHDWKELDGSTTRVCSICGGHGSVGADVHMPDCVWAIYATFLHPNGDPERAAPYSADLGGYPLTMHTSSTREGEG